jgi:hypothetical protein
VAYWIFPYSVLVNTLAGIIHFSQVAIFAGVIVPGFRCIIRRRPITVSDAARSNKALDASGGSVFRIMTGPATLD